MPPGKLAAQAGHAFLQAFEQAQRITPDIAKQYQSDPPGTKVVLVSNTLQQLLEAQDKCIASNIPHALIIDSHHILPPHFDGSPIVTAIGIGPCTRGEICHITKHFKLL